MRPAEAALAALVARRLAHDLAGPLTALGTLAALRDADPLEEAALADLRDRLALFRAIFSGAADAALDLAEAAALLERSAAGAALDLALAPDAPPARLRSALALAVEMHRLAAADGRVAVAVAASGALRVAVEPLARAVPPALEAACSGVLEGLSPEHAPTAFAAALAGPLRLKVADNGLVIEADPV